MQRVLPTYLSRLFFVKRLPNLSVPSEWQKPKNDDEMAKILDREGFVSPKYWKDDDLNKFPTFRQDLHDLEEHLLPAFFDFNQKALYYQNLFYLFQWVFMLGAFFTTFSGAATTYIYTFEPDGGNLAVGMGIFTAVLSGILSFFNVVSEQAKAQSRWANYRRLTEELRTGYYRYLSHIDPYHKEDRVQQMRQMVLAVRRKANERS